MFRTTHSKIWNRVIRSRVTQPVLGRCGANGERGLWIFILGNYNSGTTLLYELLRNQEGISSLPWEGSRLTHFFSDPNDYGWPRMWHACKEKMRAAEAELETKHARRIKRQWNWSTSGNAPVFVEKSITNATRIPFLAKHFNPAFFIHIVRNPYASSEGIQRKAHPDPIRSGSGLSSYSLSMCAQQWVTSNQLIESELSHCDSVRITYEDLCKDPKEVLEKISSSCPRLHELGVHIETHNELKVHGASGKISNQNEKSISRLQLKEREEITRVASEMMKQYGYQVTS